MNYKCYNEDCLEGMKKISDCSIDCIVTDLPYNLTDCAWDKSAIDLPAMWAEFKRILKPQCSAVLFASGKFTFRLVASNFDQYKYKWIWVKNAPTMFVHAKNAPMRKFEEILVFSDGSINHATCTNRRMKYNPQGLMSCESICQNGAHNTYGDRPSRPYLRGNNGKWGGFAHDCPSHKAYYVQEQTGYPSDVLFYDAPYKVGKLHPSQKPVPLLEYLIRTYTDEGETVLDATMGSGSTGVVCVNTGRNFIGFETEKNFYDIALKRISTAMDKQSQALF